MPDKKIIKRAKKAKAKGLSPSTQASEFVRDEIHKIRQGKHGARSAKQVIAIGLSEARRAGVDLKPPKKGKASTKTIKSAKRAYALGHGAAPKRKPSLKRSRAITKALQREGKSSVNHQALSRQAKSAAAHRSAANRSAAAKKAARTRAKSKKIN